jgi:hypothetical protein
LAGWAVIGHSGTTARNTMNENSIDHGLLDVRGLGLRELLSDPDNSAFGRALDRIMATSGNACIGGFSATI